MQATPDRGKAGASRLIGLGLLVAGLLYPFAVYLGMEHLTPRMFAVLLGVLWLARLLSGRQTTLTRTIGAIALAFCLLLGLADSGALLRWYPVLISLALLGLFGSSLWSGMPMVERLARLTEPELPPAAGRRTLHPSGDLAVGGFFHLQRRRRRRAGPLGTAGMVDALHRPDRLFVDGPAVRR